MDLFLGWAREIGESLRASGHPVLGLTLILFAIGAALLWSKSLRAFIKEKMRSPWRRVMLAIVASIAFGYTLVAVDSAYTLGVKSTEPSMDECSYNYPLKGGPVSEDNKHKYNNAEYGYEILFPLGPRNQSAIEYTVEVIDAGTARIVHIADRTDGAVERSALPGRSVKMTVRNPRRSIPPGFTVYTDGRLDLSVEASWCQCDHPFTVHIP